VTPERQIQNLICSWLKAKRALFFVHDSVGIFDPVRKCYRTNRNPYRIKGVADIIGIWQGKPLAIEVKSKAGRVSPEQRRFLAEWNAAGGIGFVARSLADVEAALKLVSPV
jgi:penicillin-binding protein-related factor A (putative recombinase)